MCIIERGCEENLSEGRILEKSVFQSLSYCVSKSIPTRRIEVIQLFPFKMSWVPQPDLPSKMHTCIIWKAACMDIELEVLCGAWIQLTKVSQLEKREQELTILCLAVAHWTSVILMTHCEVCDKQWPLWWDFMFIKEFKKLFHSPWVLWFWPESLTAWQRGVELMEGTKLIPYTERWRI